MTKVEAQMVNRGQKRRKEQAKKEEAEKCKAKKEFVGEGSGKNNTTIEQEKDMGADTESLSDCQLAWDRYFEKRRSEREEEKSETEEGEIKEPEQEEDEKLKKRITRTSTTAR